MFVGHYSVSFALKTEKNRIPLWVLFLAAQFVDVLWAIFVLLGVEKMRVVPGITASNSLDLYYMPFTHSLIGALGWSLFAYLVYRSIAPHGNAPAAAILVGMAVFSHWILDLIVHRPDLSLYDDTLKVGFGLWNFKLIELLLEIVLVLYGVFLYLKNNPSVQHGRRIGTVIFAIVLILIQIFNSYGGQPTATNEVFAISALVAYGIFAGVAFWVEPKHHEVT
ncbi:MAG TPA: hypothetical protein VKS81_08575 [Bacteroidota bacterium]|nr:hypothetical protein [Bacteroidota bacterium]